MKELKELLSKLREALISTLPITAIVYIPALTPWFNLSAVELVTFSVGAVLLLLGVCFVPGLLITVAEPDLQVLAAQISAVMNGTVPVYAAGVGCGRSCKGTGALPRKRIRSFVISLDFSGFASGDLLPTDGQISTKPLEKSCE